MSSRAREARCDAHTSGNWSGPSRTAEAISRLQDRALAELDHLPQDRVHHRDLLERGRRGAIGGMLVRLGRDVLQALVLRQFHQLKVVGLSTPMTNCNPLQTSSMAATLLSTQPVFQCELAHHVLGQVRRALGRPLGPERSTAARPGACARATSASASRRSRALGVEAQDHVREPLRAAHDRDILECEAVGRVEQQYAATGFDAELLRQRRPGIARAHTGRSYSSRRSARFSLTNSG